MSLSRNNLSLPYHASVIELLDTLTSADILYCHFKSNEHVAEGMCGDTDLDILADREYHSEITAALGSAGFKLFSSGPLTRYPAVEDWLGIDPQTGKLAHLHIHWQMVAGEPYLKGYRLPWERQILADRVWNAEYGIHTASPEMELVLLLTRAALKMRARSAIAAEFGRSAHGADLEREYAWLIARVDTDRFSDLAHSILPASIATKMQCQLAAGRLDCKEFLSLRRDLLKHLAPWRSYSPAHARLLRWCRELDRRFLQRAARKMGWLLVNRRYPASGGMIVALIGADGSGKSTQAKSLVKWLGWKIDVARVYFGSGDGPMSWHRWLLTRSQRLLGRVASPSPATPKNGNKATSINHASLMAKAKMLFRGCYALSLAWEKKSVLKRAVRARNRGMIVVCDRFPQEQFAGFNDGPLLSDWASLGWTWRAFAVGERHLRSVFASVSPDLVIKLHVSEDVSAQRKTDTPEAMIRQKIDAVRALDFGVECQVVDLNADRPLDEVTLAARAAIWKFF